MLVAVAEDERCRIRLATQMPLSPRRSGEAIPEKFVNVHESLVKSIQVLAGAALFRLSRKSGLF
jgi:hypothetical protein